MAVNREMRQKQVFIDLQDRIGFIIYLIHLLTKKRNYIFIYNLHRLESLEWLSCNASFHEVSSNVVEDVLLNFL